MGVAGDNLPTVTLIIPAYNESAVLDEKLKNSLKIDYPAGRLEILVASDGSTDQTNEIARRYADRGIRLLDFPINRGKSSTLNEAVAKSTGEILCLCDANVMFQSDALKILVSHLNDPTVGAVTGDVRLQNEISDFNAGESLYYRIERQIQIFESALGSTICVDGGMYVVRRELFLPLPADTLLDDFKTSMNVINAGQRLLYDQTAIATESGTPSAEDEFRRRVRLAAGAAQSVLRRDFPSPTRVFPFFSWVSHKFVRWVSPCWLVLLLVSNLFLWNEDWVFRIVLFGQLAFYASSIVAWLIPATRTVRPLRVGFYFVLSQVAMLRGVIQGLFLKQSGVWRRTARAPSPSRGSETPGD
ncbi:MAG: glycosyltransferase family 2 protein [Planctomycetota bacterium]|nr:glycosyltransferase family 2 protein [Planctomycetota bacterium]